MKNIFLPVLLSCFIVSCSQSPVQQANITNPATISSFDVGNGQRGANLSVKLNFNNFKTKASANGIPAKTASNVNSAKLYLITNNGANPLLASNVTFSSGVLAYPAGTASKTYTFSNVPAGTYYVAIELFSGGDGTVNIIEPITYTSFASSDTAFGLTNGKRGLTISTNSATVVSPAMTYSFSSGTSFAVSPILLNAVGAALDTTVNVQSGNGNISNGSIGIQ